MPYLLLNPLNQPGEKHASKLLGRFVTDRHDPLRLYAPEDPSPLIADHLDEDMDIMDGEVFLKSLKNDTIRAAVHKLFTAENSDTEKGDLVLNSSRISRRRLTQVRPVFQSLVNDNAILDSVAAIAKEGKTRKVYFVTGFLTIENGRINSSTEKTNDTTVSGQLSVPGGLAAAVPLTAPIAGKEIASIKVAKREERSSGISGTIQGEKVFAIEYWECKKASAMDVFRRNRDHGGFALQGPKEVDRGHLGLRGDDSEESDEDSSEFEDEKPIFVLEDSVASASSSDDDVGSLIFEMAK